MTASLAPSPTVAHVATYSSPLGPVSYATDRDGALIALVFGTADVLASRLGGRDSVPAEPGLHAAVAADLDAYFRNPMHRFSVRIAARGSPFQERVWSALRAIPVGRTRSYGALADELGSSPRAVGRANATNPVCLVVPCHRVIGADGSLTGYAFGPEIKRRLLAHEGVALA